MNSVKLHADGMAVFYAISISFLYAHTMAESGIKEYLSYGIFTLLLG